MLLSYGQNQRWRQSGEVLELLLVSFFKTILRLLTICVQLDALMLHPRGQLCVPGCITVHVHKSVRMIEMFQIADSTAELNLSSITQERTKISCHVTLLFHLECLKRPLFILIAGILCFSLTDAVSSTKET